LTIYCGIDPGLTGGIAFITPSSVVATDLPQRLVIDERDRLDSIEIGRMLRQAKPDLVVLEESHAMPKQGVSSTFRYGQAYGTLIGIIDDQELQLHQVLPKEWKKALGLAPAPITLTPSKQTSYRKRQALDLATELYPYHREQWSRIKDNHRAEALLLAHWGAKNYAYL